MNAKEEPDGKKARDGIQLIRSVMSVAGIHLCTPGGRQGAAIRELIDYLHEFDLHKWAAEAAAVAEVK